MRDGIDGLEYSQWKSVCAAIVAACPLCFDAHAVKRNELLHTHSSQLCKVDSRPTSSPISSYLLVLRVVFLRPFPRSLLNNFRLIDSLTLAVTLQCRPETFNMILIPVTTITAIMKEAKVIAVNK